MGTPTSKPKISTITVIALLAFMLPVFSVSAELLKVDSDTDRDGLNDFDETSIYRTNPEAADTDGDGYDDGTEVKYNYDPNKDRDDKIQKVIRVSLKKQELTYSLGPYIIKTVKVSTGKKRYETPKGTFSITVKKPEVDYRGPDYNYPNTRWNMFFKQGAWGGYYIHGAYWHNKFGTPVSHGCVNVPYADVEPLYNWADVGTKVIIE